MLKGVRILLPPSETKVQASSGSVYDPQALTFPELAPVRENIIEELQRISGSNDALRQLKLSQHMDAELQRNLSLRRSPAAPAHQTYTGVLYDALGFTSLDAVSQQRALRHILVFSSLWGVLGFGDAIPSYRLSIGVSLGTIGPLTAYWRTHLQNTLDSALGDELTVDCRSSGYATMWAPRPENTMKVKVFQLRDGVPTVVSHFAKHTRGELARLILNTATPPSSPTEIADLAKDDGRWTVSLEPATRRSAHALNLTLPEGVSFAKAKRA